METYKLLNKELVVQVQTLKLFNSRLQIENNHLNKRLSEINSTKLIQRCTITEDVNKISFVLNHLLSVVNPMINGNIISNETNVTDASKGITTTTALRKQSSPCYNRSLSPILDNSIADPIEELSIVSQKRGRRSLRRSLPTFEQNCEINSPCSSSSFSRESSAEEEELIEEKSLEQISVENKAADGEFKMLSTISEDEEAQISSLHKSKPMSSKHSDKESDTEDEISIEEAPKVTNRRDNIPVKIPHLSKTITEPSDSEIEESIEEAPKVTNRRDNIPVKRPHLSKTITEPSDSEIEESIEEAPKVTNRRENIQAKRPQPTKLISCPKKLKSDAEDSIESFKTSPLCSKSLQDDDSSSETHTGTDSKSSDQSSDSNESTKIHHRRNVAEAVTKRIPKPFRTMASKSTENLESFDESSESHINSFEAITETASNQDKTITERKSFTKSSNSDKITNIHHQKNGTEAVSKRVTKILKALVSNSDSDIDNTSSDTIKDVSLPKKVTKIVKKRATKPLTPGASKSPDSTLKKLSPNLTDKSFDNSNEPLASIQQRQKLKEKMKKNGPKINKKSSKGELNSPSPKKYKSDTSDSSFNESIEKKSKKTEKNQKSKLTKQTAIEKNKILTKKNPKKNVEGTLSRQSHLDIENNFNIENQIASSTPVTKKMINQTSKPNLKGAGSILNDITGTSMNASNLSSRPRRNNEAISYTEPSLHTKLRRC